MTAASGKSLRVKHALKINITSERFIGLILVLSKFQNVYFTLRFLARTELANATGRTLLKQIENKVRILQFPFLFFIEKAKHVGRSFKVLKGM